MRPEILNDWQESFLRGIRGEAVELDWQASRLAPADTWQIYRRNYLESHISALQDTYSMVYGLVGHDYFRQLAQSFVLKNDSVSGDLNDYGDQFSNHIAQSQLADLPYLPDVARVDWAWFTVFREARTPDNWLEQLLQLPQHSWTDIKIIPMAQLVESNYPIVDICLVAQGQKPSANLAQAQQSALICRHHEVTIQALNQSQTIFTKAWFAGERLEFALQAALDASAESMPTFDLVEMLKLFSTCGAIVRLNLDSVAD